MLLESKKPSTSNKSKFESNYLLKHTRFTVKMYYRIDYIKCVIKFKENLVEKNTHIYLGH